MGLVELHPAVTPLGAEHIPRQALRVDPDEDLPINGLRGSFSLVPGDQTVRERHVLLSVDLRAEEVRVEQTVVRLEGNRPFDHGLHELLVLASILDQVRDGADLEVVLGSEDLELGHPRHGPVVVHDLADDADRGAARQLGEIHDPLGLTAAHEHPAFPCPEGEDVPRPRKV